MRAQSRDGPCRPDIDRARPFRPYIDGIS